MTFTRNRCEHRSCAKGYVDVNAWTMAQDGYDTSIRYGASRFFGRRGCARRIGATRDGAKGIVAQDVFGASCLSRGL